jgi:hypothetical protein
MHNKIERGVLSFADNLITLRGSCSVFRNSTHHYLIYIYNIRRCVEVSKKHTKSREEEEKKLQSFFFLLFYLIYCTGMLQWFEADIT